MLSKKTWWVQHSIFKKIGILVLLFILVIFTRGTWSVYQKSQFSKEHRDAVSRELRNVTKREEVLKTAIKEISTPRGIEGEIRETFDVGREGERMIVLIDSPKGEKKQQIQKATFLEKIIRLFGNR